MPDKAINPVEPALCAVATVVAIMVAGGIAYDAVTIAIAAPDPNGGSIAVAFAICVISTSVIIGVPIFFVGMFRRAPRSSE